MINVNDLRTVSSQQELPFGSSSTSNAHCYLRYVVHEVADARNLGSGRAYRVECTARVVVSNESSDILQQVMTPLPTPGTTSIVGFQNYPLMLRGTAAFSQPAAPLPAGVRLLNYSPRTINAAIQTSKSSEQNNSSSTSSEHTSGSSTATTNSYGFDASLGFFGKSATGSISGGYNHASTTGSYGATTSGSQSASNSAFSESDAMSIKDWGAYAAVDPSDLSVAWLWAQEYPWSAVQYHTSSGNASDPSAGMTQIHLPAAVADRMFNTNTTVFPPSELSLFGLDLVMKAAWIIPLASAPASQQVQFSHGFDYVQGSHYLSDTNRIHAMSSAPASLQVSSPLIDLTLLGLDPILDHGLDNGAVLGFLPGTAIALANSDKFISGSNNLQVVGTGFTVPTTQAAPMLASVTSAAGASLTLNFKIVDPDAPLSLHLKHWVKSDGPCKLTISYNGAFTETHYVTAKEAEGGNDNVLEITLRNKSYGSVEYRDCLILGCNTVVIQISPADGSTAAQYALRAIALSI
ncbi:hypothetical protein [Bradyrhizobium sp. HKCCYLS20291]|uniref:hypothetical protein n=1 Tax=Bradyrhizobium sp. HKCCYLS20291 TaxID=3420766 RepID=UPI003EBCEB17